MTDDLVAKTSCAVLHLYVLLQACNDTGASTPLNVCRMFNLRHNGKIQFVCIII